MEANEAPQQYIPKSALVAEIERRKKAIVDDNGNLGFKDCQKAFNEIDELKKFINTLEVKEVDLDFQTFAKEIGTVFNLPSSETENTEENPLNWEFAIAKHFFELGMSVSNKTRKGEKA